MKRLIAAVLALCLIGSAFTGCTDAGAKQETTSNGMLILDDGTLYYEGSGGRGNYILQSIPHDMIMGEYTIPLKRISFYESYANHGYTPYLAVTLGREHLTDDDIYWMTSTNSATLDKELAVYGFIQSAENAIDMEDLTLLGTTYDDENIYYFFWGDLSRDSYMGRTFKFSIYHIPTSLTSADTVTFHYDLKITEDNFSDTVESWPTDEMVAFGHVLSNLVG